jgi:hypothetical protein
MKIPSFFLCVRTIMAAGHDSTTSSLSWALFELTKYPDIQEKLRVEIREKIMEKGNNVFSEYDYESMPYLTAVVKVSQTFYLYLPIIRVSFSSLHRKRSVSGLWATFYIDRQLWMMSCRSRDRSH